MSFLMRGSIQLATFLYSTNIVPKIQSISKIYDTRTRSEPHSRGGVHRLECIGSAILTCAAHISC